MADVQLQFETFHEAVRIDYGLSKDLRDGRDKVCDRIREHLKDEKLPGFRVLLQGSYAMKTGAKPPKGTDLEYDIDVGLRFSIDPNERTASEVRTWILDAVEGHTNEIISKGPCVRVVYAKGYHVDLVCYATWESDGQTQYRLAHKSKGWRKADPPALVDHINNYRSRFSETEDSRTKTDQFRRCVRYLRRWNDERIPREARYKPTGLAFVLLAIQKSLTPTTMWDGNSCDLRTLKGLVCRLHTTVGRITCTKPTPEYEELLSHLTDKQMDDLKDRFKELYHALDSADLASDKVEASKTLRGEFGDDFPVPDSAKSAIRTTSPAIVTSSTSA